MQPMEMYERKSKSNPFLTIFLLGEGKICHISTLSYRNHGMVVGSNSVWVLGKPLACTLGWVNLYQKFEIEKYTVYGKLIFPKKWKDVKKKNWAHF